MFAVRSLFILTSVSCYECYNVLRVPGQERMIKNNIENIIQHYVKPIEQLSAVKFPGHEIEVQVEVLGSITHAPRLNSRRRMYLYKPPKSRDLFVRSKTAEPTQPSATTTVPTTTSTTTMVPPSVGTGATGIKSASKSLELANKDQRDPKNQLVYRKDLVEALKGLEKRICKNKDCLNTSRKQLTGKYSGRYNQEDGNYESQHNFENPENGNEDLNDEGIMPEKQELGTTVDDKLNRIVRLLQRGIKIQKQTPKINDGNMEWMQIKVPKDTLIYN